MSEGDSAAGVGRGRLAGRLIGLGVTGSIAAYKAPELVRRLQAEGAEVQVVLTPSAARFVAPLALEALSRLPVEQDVLALLPDQRIGHIVLADAADALVVAPATAHWLGAMANGLAGDAVTATVLASSAPVVVAPAMDGEMYGHPATQANVRRLREFGTSCSSPRPDPSPRGSRAWGGSRISSGSSTRWSARSGRGPSASRIPPRGHRLSPALARRTSRDVTSS